MEDQMFRREVNRTVRPVLVAVLASAFVLAVSGPASAIDHKPHMRGNLHYSFVAAPGILGTLEIRFHEHNGVPLYTGFLRRLSHDRSHVDGNVHSPSGRCAAEVREMIRQHVTAALNGAAVPQVASPAPSDNKAPQAGRTPTFHFYSHDRSINERGNYLSVKVHYRERRQVAKLIEAAGNKVVTTAEKAGDAALGAVGLTRSSQCVKPTPAGGGSLGPAVPVAASTAPEATTPPAASAVSPR